MNECNSLGYSNVLRNAVYTNSCGHSHNEDMLYIEYFISDRTLTCLSCHSSLDFRIKFDLLRREQLPKIAHITAFAALHLYSIENTIIKSLYLGIKLCHGNAVGSIIGIHFKRELIKRISIEQKSANKIRIIIAFVGCLVSIINAYYNPKWEDSFYSSLFFVASGFGGTLESERHGPEKEDIIGLAFLAYRQINCNSSDLCDRLLGLLTGFSASKIINDIGVQYFSYPSEKLASIYYSSAYKCRRFLAGASDISASCSRGTI